MLENTSTRLTQGREYVDPNGNAVSCILYEQSGNHVYRFNFFDTENNMTHELFLLKEHLVIMQGLMDQVDIDFVNEPYQEPGYFEQFASAGGVKPGEMNVIAVDSNGKSII